jgi:hypothetical protein
MPSLNSGYLPPLFFPISLIVYKSMVHLFKKKEKEKNYGPLNAPSLSNNNSPSPHPIPMLLPLLAASHYPLSLFNSA